MKTVFLLALVVVIQGRSLTKRDSDLPVPVLTKITAVDPLGFEVEWESANGDFNGYKVKVWELPTNNVLHYETISGKKVLVPEKSSSQFPSLESIPENRPREFTIPKGGQRHLLVKGLKLSTLYEVRAQTYRRDIVGALSVPMRIKLG